MKARVILSILLVVPMVLAAGTAFASSEGGTSPWNTWMLMWRVVNTVALVALLVYFLKKPLVSFFAERRIQIEKDLADAREQRERAERIIAEYKEKIAGMERELEKMRADLEKAAEAESRKVTGNAERMASAMVEAARMAAEQEVRKAKVILKNEAVDMAVKLAETLIREKITDSDRKKIMEDYLDKVGGMK